MFTVVQVVFICQQLFFFDIFWKVCLQLPVGYYDKGWNNNNTIIRHIFFCHYMEKISAYINISNWPKWIRKGRPKSSVLHSCYIDRTIVSLWHQMTFYNVRHCLGNLVYCCANGQFINNSKTNLQVNYSFTVQTVYNVSFHLHMSPEKLKYVDGWCPFHLSDRWWKMDS